MTKSELVSNSAPDQLALRELAKEIQEHHAIVESMVSRIKNAGPSLLVAARDAGVLFLKAKERVGHGNFLTWADSNCPTISPRNRNRYISIAQHWDKLANLPDGASLRSALLLCHDDPPFDDGKEPAKRRPPYLEAITRFTGISDYVTRHPATDWPEEGRRELAAQITELIRRLGLVADGGEVRVGCFVADE